MISTLVQNHKYWLCAGLTGLAMLLPQLSLAQDSLVLSVSPTLFEMSANREQTWSSSVRVINANNFPITVYAEPVNFAPAGEAGQGTLVPVFAQEATGDTLAEWIDVSLEQIVIPPEQTVSVPFTISVPADAAPGGHFAAILIGTRSFDDGAGQAQVETSQVVTSLVFLRVAGDIEERGNIRQFNTTQSVYDSTNASFEVRFENTGNVHIQPQGEIEIRNMWGQVRGRIPINKNSQFGNVLPESLRSYSFRWSAQWSLADVGRHTAEVTLAYGDQTRQFADATTYFWVIPWKILLVAGICLALFIWLFIWGIKLYIKRMLHLAGVTPELHQRSATKRVSAAAPIEAGLLDLRNQIKHGSGSTLHRLWSVIKAYRVFVMLVAAGCVFVGLLGWYAVLVLTSDYSYQAYYQQPDGSQVELRTATEPAASDAVPPELIPITVFNHSGVSEGVELVASNLADSPYQLVEAYEQTKDTKDRSVLVYDPAYLDTVVELQSLLPGILVSSYVSENESDPSLVLYLGSDLTNQ